MADNKSRELNVKSTYERELIEGEPENGWKTHTLGDMRIKLEVDCADALTGLKAIQREAKKAAQALRELEEAQKVTEEITVDVDGNTIARWFSESVKREQRARGLGD